MPGAIPFEAIDCFAARFGPYDLDDLQRFVTLIGAMDAEYVQHQVRELQKKAK